MRHQQGVLRGVVLAAGLAVLAAAAVYGWQQWNIVEVQTVRPQRGPAVRAVYASGVVEGVVMLSIAPRVAGRLMEIYVDEGDRVIQGEVLARLDDTDLEQRVAELAARTEFARQSHERAEAMFRRGVGSGADRDRARSELDAAEAALARAKTERAYMILTAPAAGQVLRRDGEVGEFVPVNQAVFRMACCEGLRVSAQVDEEDIPLVQPGQAALVHADAFPEQDFGAEVSDITPMGDPVTRTYRVRLSLPDGVPLRIGMTVDTNIVVERRDDALLVPATALASERLWLLQGDRVRAVPVQPGIHGEQFVEVRAGLDEQATVVDLPPAGLRDGQRVRVASAP